MINGQSLRVLSLAFAAIAVVVCGAPTTAHADPLAPHPYFEAGASLNAAFFGLAHGIQGGGSIGAGAMWSHWALGLSARDSAFVPDTAHYQAPCVDAPCFEPLWEGHLLSFDAQARWFPWTNGPAVPFFQASAGWTALLLADHATGQADLSAEGVHLEADLGVALPVGDHFAAFALLGDSFSAVHVPQGFTENRTHQGRVELGVLIHL